MIHDDVADILIIFGLITFGKVKLYPLSSIIRSVIHEVMTRLIFVDQERKLGGGMWL